MASMDEKRSLTRVMWDELRDRYLPLFRVVVLLTVAAISWWLHSH